MPVRTTLGIVSIGHNICGVGLLTPFEGAPHSIEAWRAGNNVQV